jgi:predicted MFS family arabinose efflux permease
VSRLGVRGLTPLRHRDFRLLAGGQLASNIGDSFYAVALPWYVLAEHGGAILLGTVLVGYGIPRTALVLAGGHASDRWRPWTVMMSTDAARALAVSALAVAAALGPARAVVLVPIAAVLGAGEGLFMPGSFAIIPTLLPDADLQAGNALSSAGTQLATLIGPAAGGAMVAFLGPAPAFALDAASFVISAVTLAGIRAARRSPGRQPRGPQPRGPQPRGPQPRGPQPAVAADPGQPGPDGPSLWSVLRSERFLQVGLLVTIAANLGSGGSDEVALPSLAHGPLHAGAGGFGALIAAFGAGALAGTIFAGQAGRARRPAVLGSFVFLAEAAALAAVPYAGSTVTVGAVLLAVGAANGFGNVVMITAFQRWAPPDLLGRLAGLLTLASLGVFPVSVALAALVVRSAGPAPFFPLAGAMLAAAILAGLSQRAWRSFGMSNAGANQAPAASQSTAAGDDTADPHDQPEASLRN